MSQTPAIRLYKGRTTHVRYTPFERRFDYRIFMIDVDIDRLEEASKSSWLFSIGSPNLFSFKQTDHGARQKAPLRPWAEAELAKAGVKLDGGSIRLVTFPRGLFYKFAPISIWYGLWPKRRIARYHLRSEQTHSARPIATSQRLMTGETSTKATKTFMFRRSGTSPVSTVSQYTPMTRNSMSLSIALSMATVFTWQTSKPMPFPQRRLVF